MIPLHDRMPVILKKEYERTWLEKPFLEILQPYPSELMKRYQISTLVNNPENDTVDIIKPSEQKTLG
jgi:putative SOS response-associated peptidase YedK